jgi:hypothetical protein
VEIHKEWLAKRAAVGVTRDCYECGQPGHWSHGCPGKVPFSGGLGSQGEGLVGAWPERGAYRGLPGRAPWSRGNYRAVAGGQGRGTKEYLGDAATTYGGDALPPHPSAIRHSPTEPMGAEPHPASLNVVAQDRRWERKRSLDAGKNHTLRKAVCQKVPSQK